jgi:hypothetical protein
MAISIRANIDQVIKGLDAEKAAAEKVVRRTIGDMRTRAPGWVSKAVREEYAISAGDVKSAMRVGNDGKVSVAGTEVDNVTLTYSGRVLTPTHFKMRPTSRPASGVPYQITAEIKKGQRKPLSSRAFLAHAGGAGTTEIPFQREGSSRLPIKPIKTLSVPQMIESKDGTKPEIEKAINEGLEKRFNHYCDIYLGGGSKTGK